MAFVTKVSAVATVVVFLAAWAAADEPAPKTITLNVKRDGVKKFEANQSQIGYTNTRVFYTLAEQKAVVVVLIDNKAKGEFPVSASLHLFAPDTTAEGLAKWLNNQHSDGLFPDVPEPVSTVKLPAEAGKLTSSKAQGRVDAGLGTYDKFAVNFSVAATNVRPGLRLEEFKDSTSVYVPVK